MLQKTFTALTITTHHRTRRLAALAGAALSTGLLAAAVSRAQAAAETHPATIAAASSRQGITERGKIVGWPGGDAVIYPTAHEKWYFFTPATP